jgi:DNA-binding beta-propeller fold protein YncE
VLGDAEHRVAVLGGREGMPRSLGSVYGGSITRFLGGSCRGVASRVIRVPPVAMESNGFAVSHNGGTLLLSDGGFGGSNAVLQLRTADGRPRRAVGSWGDGPLHFNELHQLCIAPDGFVFVADAGNNRVQVLTPSLDFHGLIGVGRLQAPVGVCANADVVLVCEVNDHRVSVFNRHGGALVRSFGSCGSGDGQLSFPRALCLMSGDRHVAVVDYENCRVTVFSIDGEFIRHIGAGIFSCPQGIAASAFDELVVADYSKIRVFSATGDLLAIVAEGRFSGLAVHGSALFAASDGCGTSTVTVFT